MRRSRIEQIPLYGIGQVRWKQSTLKESPCEDNCEGRFENATDSRSKEASENEPRLRHPPMWMGKSIFD